MVMRISNMHFGGALPLIPVPRVATGKGQMSSKVVPATSVDVALNLLLIIA